MRYDDKNAVKGNICKKRINFIIRRLISSKIIHIWRFMMELYNVLVYGNDMNFRSILLLSLFAYWWLRDSWPWSVQFRSKDLFSHDSSLQTSRIVLQILVLRPILLPVDGLKAEVHKFVIEVQTLWDLHKIIII